MSDSDPLIAYLRRAYHAVDGLWFMKVEEAHGFETALDLDRRVWEILAKIQARQARTVLEISGDAPEDLAACFTLKLTADGHDFTVETTAEGVEIAIRGCPWLELLRKSDRQELAARIAQTICPTEGRVWCREFGDRYLFSMPQMACQGTEGCVMRFERRQPSE
jgi:hypothetical protein